MTLDEPIWCNLPPEDLRRMTPAERFQIARVLSQREIDRIREELRHAHPEASREELLVLFVARLYGTEVAEGFAASAVR